MTDTSSPETCDCGASAGPLGLCVDYYHAILAEEQSDPQMYRWHTLVVCAYLLQHPSRAHPKYLDGQFRQLQLFADKGLDALLATSAHQVAWNKRGSGTTLDPTPLAPYKPLPPGGPPTTFATSFTDLPFTNNTFTAAGHQPYGQAIESISKATVEAWSARASSRNA